MNARMNVVIDPVGDDPQHTACTYIKGVIDLVFFKGGGSLLNQ